MLALFPVFYFLALIGIGLSHRRPMTGEADFFLARRSGSTLLLTGSLLATILGSFGVLGVSGLGYQMGLVAGWYLWAGIIGLGALGLWALRQVDFGGVYTLPELLGRSFGQPVRVFSALLIALSWLSIIAAQLIAAGKILHFLGVASGWWVGGAAEQLLIGAVAVVFIVYTCLGGQHSVLRTDLFQALLIVAALVALLGAAIGSHPGAFAALPESFRQWPLGDSMPAGKWLTILLTLGVPFLVGPDIYSRVFSGRDAETGRRSILAAAVLLGPIVLMVVVAGMLGRAILGPGMADADTVLLQLAQTASSPIWCGLLIAALLAAVMSSADTCLLTVSTLVSRDLLDVLAPRMRREERVVARGRLIILAAGIVSLLLALKLGSIVKALLICYTIYSPAVLCPFLALAFFPRWQFRPATGVAAMALAAACAGAGIYLGSDALKLAAFGVPLLPLASDLMSHRSTSGEVQA